MAILFTFLLQRVFRKDMLNTRMLQVVNIATLILGYRVVAKEDYKEFGGYEKKPSELFDTQKEMIAFYQGVSL